MTGQCSVPGCFASLYCKGLCTRHYQRVRTNGCLDRPRRSLEHRFWSRVEKADTCWEWTGVPNAAGYGVFGDSRRRLLAHRVAYVLAVGPIPDGMQVDHICRVRICVRPDHLRLATNKQNSENLSSVGRGASGVRGVGWDSSRGLWSARVKHNYRTVWLGRFPTVAEAADAVLRARLELFTYNDSDRQVSA